MNKDTKETVEKNNDVRVVNEKKHFKFLNGIFDCHKHEFIVTTCMVIAILVLTIYSSITTLVSPVLSYNLIPIELGDEVYKIQHNDNSITIVCEHTIDDSYFEVAIMSYRDNTIGDIKIINSEYFEKYLNSIKERENNE